MYYKDTKSIFILYQYPGKQEEFYFLFFFKKNPGNVIANINNSVIFATSNQ